jgi:uncharacterized cupredoxin-like copper-binding protein
VRHTRALTAPSSAFASLAVLALAAFTVAGCGSGSKSAAGAQGRVINVVEKDFHLKAPGQVRAGHVVVRVHNKGPDAHEFIMVRLKAGAALPLRSDGMSVDEDAVEQATVATLEPGPPNSTRTVEVALAPGRYELLCNMSGHFMGGMHQIMVAR